MAALLEAVAEEDVAFPAAPAPPLPDERAEAGGVRPPVPVVEVPAESGKGGGIELLRGVPVPAGVEVRF